MKRVVADSLAPIDRVHRVQAETLVKWMECAEDDGGTTLIVERRGGAWDARWVAEIPEVSSDELRRLAERSLSQRASPATSKFVPFGQPRTIYVVPVDSRSKLDERRVWAVGECRQHIVVMDGIGRCDVVQGGSQLLGFAVDLIDLLERVERM